MDNKKRIIVGVLLYLIGIALFIVANLEIVSECNIDLEDYQRAILGGISIISIVVAPFVCKTKTLAGTIIKFVIAVVLILGIIVFGLPTNAVPLTMGL